MHENSAEVSDLLAEILEDVAMEQAIVEGEATEIVSRESIFQLLKIERLNYRRFSTEICSTKKKY
jgi:hypothetical protein